MADSYFSIFSKMVGDSANGTPRSKMNTRSVSENVTPSNPDERSSPKGISPQVSYGQPVDATTERVIPIRRGPSAFDKNRLESILNTDCSSTSTLSETDLSNSYPAVSGILNQAAQEPIRNSSQLSSGTALAANLEKEVLNNGRTVPISSAEFSTPASQSPLSNSPGRHQNNILNRISSPAVPEQNLAPRFVVKVRSPSEITAQEHKPNNDSATSEPAVLAANNQNQVSEPNAAGIPVPNFTPAAHVLPDIRNLASNVILSQAETSRRPTISLDDDAYKALMTKLGNRHERDYLFSLRVDELKLVLSKYNLSKRGLKADLRDTIIYYITSITDEAKKAQVWKYVKEVSDARQLARYNRYTILPIQHVQRGVPIGPHEKICPTLLGDETKIQLKPDPNLSLVFTVTRLKFSAATNVFVEIQISLTASQLALMDSKENNFHCLVLHCIRSNTADTPNPPIFFPVGCHAIYFGGRWLGNNSNNSGPLKLYSDGPLSSLTTLKISWHRPHDESYIIVVEIVRAKSPKEMLDDILINCFKSKEDILKTRIYI